MKRNNKKGFTIVELVIVIAVIAILAAVLIPTFSSVIKKAKVNNDIQLVRNLNTALATDTKEHKTMQDALDAAFEFGYDVAKINDTSVDENKILWDSKNDVFCYLKDSTLEYVPNSVADGDKLSADSYLLWTISKTVDTTFSTYLYNYEVTETTKKVIALKGLDVGKTEGITEIKYENNAEGATPQNVVIRTNSFDTVVTVTAFESGTFGSDDYKCDSIRHFGDAKEVNIIKAGQASYHEFGNVGFTQVASGKFVAEVGSKTNTVVATAADAVIDINGGEIEHKYATDASFGESNSKGNVELEVIAPSDVEQKKQDAIDEVTPAPEDPYLALVDTIEKDPRAATAIYAAVISGEKEYVFDRIPDVIAGQSINIILLNNDSSSFILGVNSNITVDINGKTLSIMEDGIGATIGTTLTLKDTKGTGSVVTTSIAPFDSTIIIESGSYTFNEFGMMGNMFGTVIVTGGTFNVDPTAYVDTENYDVTESNGTWTVSAK